jgi:hypothetical protein
VRQFDAQQHTSLHTPLGEQGEQLPYGEPSDGLVPYPATQMEISEADL